MGKGLLNKLKNNSNGANENKSAGQNCNGGFIGDFLHRPPAAEPAKDGSRCIIEYLCFGPAQTVEYLQKINGSFSVKYSCPADSCPPPLLTGNWMDYMNFVSDRCSSTEIKEYQKDITKQQMAAALEEEIELCRRSGEANMIPAFEHELELLSTPPKSADKNTSQK